MAQLGARQPGPRIATSWTGAGEGRRLLLLTLRGTPTLYYGDEIGMADVRFL